MTGSDPLPHWQPWRTISGADPGRLVFGTWQLGGLRQGFLATNFSLELIKAAFESGVRAFDSSSMYGNGRSEVLIGSALADVRDDVFLISKAGYILGYDGAQEICPTTPQDFRETALFCSLEHSLTRLHSECLDAFLLHDPPEEVIHDRRVWQTLRRMRENNLTRLIGVSTSPRKAILAIEQGAEVVEILYNKAKTEAADRLLCFAADRHVVVLARSPFSGGPLLDFAQSNGQFRETLVRELLQFPLARPEVTAMVVGMASTLELKENLRLIAE